MVSLTSYPERIHAVPAVIASLLKQSKKPDIIVLWLAEEQFPEHRLPAMFKYLQQTGVQIRFCKNYRSHKKYFEAFRCFQNDIVITVDDDIMYEHDVIEKLYLSYLNYPEAVSALSVHKIRFYNNAALKGYAEWIGGYEGNERQPSHGFFATGSGGVLYPPHCMPEEIFNFRNMMRLCPTHDDLWLKIMEVIHGTKVVPAERTCRTRGTVIRGTQRNLALGIINLTLGENDRQMEAVLKEYNGWYKEAALTDIMAYDLEVSGFTKNSESGQSVSGILRIAKGESGE